MLVSSPEAGRVRSFADGARKLLLALAALLAALCLVSASPASAAKAPKLLKKTKILAPSSVKPVAGTLKGTKQCAIRFPAANKLVSMTVTGPLSKKKPKTKKLKVKKGSRTSSCTWSTRSYADGRYRLAIKAKVKAGGRYWNVSTKRTVTIKNAVPKAGANPKAMATAGDGPGLGVGNTRYVGRLESSWDNWINTSGLVESGWMRQHMWGAVAHTGFFDSKLKWAPPTLVYKDLYAVYANDAATLAAHPEWVLKDAAGNRMAIPWGCSNGTCPQYAGDIGNPAFRANWIAQARAELAKGYVGLWIDDANMEMRISDFNQVEKPPVDPRTGTTMTYANWRKYIAEFLEQIRRELPNAQLVANVLWFGGTSIGRDSDQFIQRAYTAVDRLNLERGFNDDGLTGGSSARDIWSVEAFMSFIDRMHDRGIPVTLDSIAGDRGKPAWEYNLAGYYLVDRGEDAIGELSLPPGEWWAGWDLKLGDPKADRLRRADGVYTREFAQGLVFLNPPRGAAKKITLPRPMKRIDGSVVSSVTLASPGAAVLLPA